MNINNSLTFYSRYKKSGTLLTTCKNGNIIEVATARGGNNDKITTNLNSILSKIFDEKFKFSCFDDVLNFMVSKNYKFFETKNKEELYIYNFSKN